MTTNWRTRIFHTILWHKICSSFQSTSLLCIQLNSYKYKCVYPFTFSTVRSCSDPRGIEFPPTFRAILIIKPRWPQSMLHTKYKPLSISICPCHAPFHFQVGSDVCWCWAKLQANINLCLPDTFMCLAGGFSFLRRVFRRFAERMPMFG